MSRPFADFVHPEDKEATAQAVRSLSEQNPVHAFVNRYRCKDGSWRWLEWRSYPRGDTIYAAARDITQRVETAQRLKDSEQRLAGIFDHLPDATFVIDAGGRVIAWNKAVEAMTGVPASEVLGKGNYAHALPFYGVRRPILADLVLKPDAGIESLYTNLRRQGQTLVAETHLPNLGHGGIYVWAKATALYDAQGRLVGAIESVRDTTDRRRAEEERLRLESQMQQVQKLESLGVLAGGIAHDFNNLLMAVLGNAGLALLDLPPAHPARENLSAIETASRRAADLCRQMLAYAGKGRFVVQALDLNAVIREMTHLLDVSISKKVALRYRLADNLPAVEADASQMRQVIMNLITNASEAIGERSGVISITTAAMECDREYLSEMPYAEGLEPGPYVSVEVADTGCGMDEATKARIFDPFFTTKFTGRGLGLAAVLGIVRGHRGAVKVYSEPGQGSTFKVLLPASAQPAQEESARAGTGGWKGSGKALLVDDEETVRVVGQRMLERLGFEVVCAGNGAEALAIFRERPGDFVCVILDLTMPHMDGEETFRELRRVRPDVCVVLSSGYNEQEVTQRFAGKGLAGFIQKPYQIDALAQALRKALGGGKPSNGR